MPTTKHTNYTKEDKVKVRDRLPNVHQVISSICFGVSNHSNVAHLPCLR